MNMRLKRRGDFHWRGWGLHWDREYYYKVDTPLGSFGIDIFGEQTESLLSRGRRREWELNIPLHGEWQIELTTPGKDYLTLVGGPKYLRNLDWILDEFDSSFNDLAVASLRYHLDFSVCDNSDRRDVYEDLIIRLSEPAPGGTPREDAGMATWDPLFEADSRGRHVLTECPPEAKAAFDSWQSREDAWNQRINQARHDFVNIMRELWS